MKGRSLLVVLVLLASYHINITAPNSPSFILDNPETYSVQAGDPLENTSSLVWGNVTYSSAIDTSQSVVGFGTTVDDDGNYYVVGKHHTSFSIDGNYVNKTSGSLGSDVFLLKFHSNGTLDWGIGGSSNANSWGSGVAIGPNGTIYITGVADGYVTFGNYTTSDSMFVAKFSASGEPLWAKSGSTGCSYCGGLDVIVDSNGNAYVSGMRSDYTGFLAKIDTSGNWTGYPGSINYGGTGPDSITGLAIDEGGSIYAAMTNFSTTSKSVVTVMKFNSSNFLTPIWSKNLASGDHTVMTVCGGGYLVGCQWGGGIEIDSNGDIVIIGNSRSAASGSLYDAYVAKLDSNGSTLWKTKMPFIADNGNYNSYASGLVIDESDNLFVSGFVLDGRLLGSIGGGQNDLFLAKISSEGTYIDGFSYGSAEGELLYDSSIKPNGELVIAGLVKTGTYGSTTVPDLGAGSGDKFVHC